MQVRLCHRKDIPKQEYGNVSPLFHGAGHLSSLSSLNTSLTQRFNTFLELKMKNEHLQHRVRELKQKLMQNPSDSTSTSTMALSSNFHGHPSSPTSSAPPTDLATAHASSTARDHSELAISINLNAGGIGVARNVTRDLDTAAFQEGNEDEPAKKKVRLIYTSTRLSSSGIEIPFRPRDKFHRPHNGCA